MGHPEGKMGHPEDFWPILMGYSHLLKFKPLHLYFSFWFWNGQLVFNCNTGVFFLFGPHYSGSNGLIIENKCYIHNNNIYKRICGVANKNRVP